MGSGQYYDPHTGRFLTRGVNSQQTNPYVPWAADPSGMLYAPLALFSLVYGRRKKQAAKWEILLLVLLMGGSLALGLGVITVSAHSSQTTAVQAPSVPAAFYTSVQRGGTVSGNLPRISGTPNDAPTTTCVISVRGRIVGSLIASELAVQIYVFTGFDLSKDDYLNVVGPYADTQIPIFNENVIKEAFGLEYENIIYGGAQAGYKEGTAIQQVENDVKRNNTAPKIIYAYSAGCDTAVIYAEKLLEAKIPVLGIVLIGGPFYCGETDPTDPGGNKIYKDAEQWRNRIDSLYNQGVSIMVINDAGTNLLYGKGPSELTQTYKKFVVDSIWADDGNLAAHDAYTHVNGGQNKLAVELQEKVFGFTHDVLNYWTRYCINWQKFLDRKTNPF